MRYRSYIHFTSPADLLVHTHDDFDAAYDYCRHVVENGYTITRYGPEPKRPVAEFRHLPPASVQAVHIMPVGGAQ